MIQATNPAVNSAVIPQLSPGVSAGEHRGQVARRQTRHRSSSARRPAARSAGTASARPSRNVSRENAAAVMTVLKCSGGRSIGPAARSPRTSTATVPALTRNTNSDPPTTTTPRAARNAASTTGRDIKRGDDRRGQISPARATSAPRARRPTPARQGRSRRSSGIATSTLNSESATAWTTTTGQLAAAIERAAFQRVFQGVTHRRSC